MSSYTEPPPYKNVSYGCVISDVCSHSARVSRPSRLGSIRLKASEGPCHSNRMGLQPGAMHATNARVAIDIRVQGFMSRPFEKIVCVAPAQTQRGAASQLNFVVALGHRFERR